MTVTHRGQTFSGYNQPKNNTGPGKHKKIVLAKKGDKVKIVRFGHKDYGHNINPKRKANYLSRSAGIRDKHGNLTKDDKFSANYWSRKKLWPANKPTVAEKRAHMIYGLQKEAFDTKSQLAFAHGAKVREPLTPSVFNMFKQSLQSRAADPNLSEDVRTQAATLLRRAESAATNNRPLQARDRKLLSSVFEAAPGKAGYVDSNYANRAVFTSGSAHNRTKGGTGAMGGILGHGSVPRHEEIERARAARKASRRAARTPVSTAPTSILEVPTSTAPTNTSSSRTQSFAGSLSSSKSESPKTYPATSGTFTEKLKQNKGKIGLGIGILGALGAAEYYRRKRNKEKNDQKKVASFGSSYNNLEALVWHLRA
jgi:hypothetical protein